MFSINHILLKMIYIEKIFKLKHNLQMAVKFSKIYDILEKFKFFLKSSNPICMR